MDRDRGRRGNRKESTPGFRSLVGLVALVVFLLAPLPEPHLPPRKNRQNAGQVASGSTPVPPVARSILGDTSYRFELNLDPRGGVRVDTLASLHPLPDTMTFRLYRDDRTSKSITLQAVSPPPGSAKVYQQPH